MLDLYVQHIRGGQAIKDIILIRLLQKYSYYGSSVMPLPTFARSKGLCVQWTHSSIFDK